jgi:hypothetical protein
MKSGPGSIMGLFAVFDPISAQMMQIKNIAHFWISLRRSFTGRHQRSS